MLRKLIAITILAWATVASATFTFSNVMQPGVLNSRCVTTTGTESNTLAAGSGLDMSGIQGFTVHVKTSGSNMTAGGVLQAYLLNPIDGTWNRVADGSMDLTVSAAASQAFAGFRVQPSTHGRIAYLPSGVGLAVTIDINGTSGR